MGSIAYLVTAHGFGHAARAAAVADAVAALRPELGVHVFTTVPRWFFAESLRCSFTYHRAVTDVGLVQCGPLEEDLVATLARLGELLPPRPAEVDGLARRLERAGCRLVVCDQAPMGLAAARRVGMPAVLVESFTWDWIYRAYVAERPAFAPFIETLEELTAAATLRIQTEPVCRRAGDALTVAPVSRALRDPEGVRARLGLPAEEPVALLSMGGLPGGWPGLAALEEGPITWVVPGAARRPQRRGRVLALPHHSGHYHPDLVRAADMVLAKLGYSTVAEAWAAGTPLAFIPRPTCPESPPLGEFARDRLGAVEVEPAAWRDGTWVERVPALLSQPRREAGRNGAAAAAAAVVALVG